MYSGPHNYIRKNKFHSKVGASSKYKKGSSMKIFSCPKTFAKNTLLAIFGIYFIKGFESLEQNNIFKPQYL